MTGLLHKIADKVTSKDHDEHGNKYSPSSSYPSQQPSYSSGFSYRQEANPARYGGPQPSRGYQQGYGAPIQNYASGGGYSGGPFSQQSDGTLGSYSQQPVRDGRHMTGEGAGVPRSARGAVLA